MNLDCSLCWGFGGVIRGAALWPCLDGCPPPIGRTFLRTHIPAGREAASRIGTRSAAAYAGKTMAHLWAELGAFRSVGEAKRNGWNKPVAPGQYRVGRRMLEVVE